MPPLFYQPRIPDGVFSLDAEESRHCVKVLRYKAGDVISITDGKGFFYDAVVTRADARQCEFEIKEKAAAPVKHFFIHIAISPTKNTERLEWFVEKATEFGIDAITLVDCRNTERTSMKVERLVKVAVSAMKQSVKAVLPRIAPAVVPLSDVIADCAEEEKCIAYVDPTNPVHLRDAVSREKSYCVLIGPEGDFSSDELQSAIAHGFRKVGLGPSRLRTETAGIATCHVLNLVNSH
jgi:16S rRNA (uracil1498-N3)-methyltransferase